MQQMNERGLINSSLAAGATQDALIRNGLQIAQPDASTFADAAKTNAGQGNAWNLAQQELSMKGGQFSQELAFKREQMMMDADLRRELHLMGLDSATMSAKLDNIERDVNLIQSTAIPRLVPFDRYQVVEKVVYGTVGLILISFLGALLTLVVRQ